MDGSYAQAGAQAVGAKKKGGGKQLIIHLRLKRYCQMLAIPKSMKSNWCHDRRDDFHLAGPSRMMAGL
jgi:hypothetical protein